jgi:hypothetical protein
VTDCKPGNGFRKQQEIDWTAQRLPASQAELCSLK